VSGGDGVVVRIWSIKLEAKVLGAIVRVVHARASRGLSIRSHRPKKCKKYKKRLLSRSLEYTTMSGFFTIPASQKKRKRADGPRAPDTKRRITTSNDKRRTPGTTTTSTSANGKSKARPVSDDESISGSETDDEAANRNLEDASVDSGDDARESAAERRLKLAERYLQNIREEVGDGQEIGFDAEDVDRDLIAARLKEDVAEEQGKLYRRLAGELDYKSASHTLFRADTLATTGVASCPPYVYTVSKDMTIIKWEIPPPPASKTSHARRKPKQLLYTRGSKKHASDPSYKHHTASILCIAVSTDSRFLATGGADNRLIIWDAATLKPLRVFTQHRDSVTALAFRGKTNQLFSASKDRTIKIWSLDELAYVDTLFGHQDEVVDVSAVGGKEERCISVGARDRSARVWKVVEESQLVFRGGGGGGGSAKNELDERILKGLKMGKQRRRDQDAEITDPTSSLPTFREGSLDRVLALSTSLFITGSDSGSLSLFSLHKKKPLHVVSLAHGYDAALSPALSSAEIGAESRESQAQPTPRWITALAGIPGCDLFVTGSWDGIVRVWRVSADDRRIESVGVLGEGLPATKIAFGDNAAMLNGDQDHTGLTSSATTTVASAEPSGTIRGIINDLTVFQVGERASGGICIVAAVGTETRLGRWIQRKGKNGAVMFMVPMASLVIGNGIAEVDAAEEA